MQPLEDSPPRRSREQLEAWVKDFERAEPCIAGSITVAPVEDDGGQDTGLVILEVPCDGGHWQPVVWRNAVTVRTL